MFDPKTLAEIREQQLAWEAQARKMLRKDEIPTRETLSGLKVKPVYTPEDVKDLSFNDIGWPGGYPMARQLYPLGYLMTPWMNQQVMGHGLAEHSREVFDRLVAEGMEGYFGHKVMNLVFDNPTKGGIDPDWPEARGHVGVGGMNFSNLRDLEDLTRGLDLETTNISMITGDTCLYALAAYVIAAEKQGFDRKVLKGNSMNWLLKNWHVDNMSFPAKNALYLTGELIEFASRHMPYWNTLNISGYLMREAGANAIQELAYCMSWGREVIRHCVNERGLDVDSFAGRFGFQISCHMDLFEEVAKMRAWRIMWARMLKEEFGARNFRTWQARFHVHTCGHALTAQQPLVNIVRATIQSLAAVLGGTQSLHTCGYDEALTIPTEESHRLTLRTQQVLMYETGITNVVDPLGGSWYVESLTQQMIEEAQKICDKIEAMGGYVAAIESGYLRRVTNEEAYKYHEKIRRGERIVVGLNKFQIEEKEQPQIFHFDPGVEQEAIRRIRKLKAERDNAAVQAALNRLRDAARGREGLMDAVMECAKLYATQGEVMNVFKDVFGWGWMP